MNILPAYSHELPIIYQLLQESAEWLQSKNLNQWSIWLNPSTAPTYLRDWIEKSMSNGEFFFVKNEENTNKNPENSNIPFSNVLGMYRLMYKDEMFWENAQENAGYIHSFVVRRHHKGQNLGTKMLQYIENTLKNNEIYLLRLDCNGQNTALCNYYEAQGFVKVGEKQMNWGVNNLYEKTINK